MLPRFLAKLTELAYVLLRFVTGALFAIHGAQKVFGVLGVPRMELTSQAGIGGLIELVTGAMIALGIFTSWAAFLASGTMAVAYIQFHWKLKMGTAFLPMVNQGELAVLYCFVFFFIACRGGGKMAIRD